MENKKNINMRGKRKTGVARKRNGSLLPREGSKRIAVKQGDVRKYYTVRGKKVPRKSPEEIAKKRELMDKALAARISGMSYPAIGKTLQLGTTPGSATKKAQALVREALMGASVELTDEYLKIQLMRLDAMRQVLTRDFYATEDPDQRVRLMDALLRIMAQEDKYLNVGNAGDRNLPSNQINIQNFHSPGSPNGVLIIQGNEPEYLASLERAAGSKVPQLEFSDAVVPQKDDAIEGEVVRDDE